APPGWSTSSPRAELVPAGSGRACRLNPLRPSPDNPLGYPVSGICPFLRDGWGMSRSGTSGASAPLGSLSPEERRTERSIALVRMAVVAVVADVYLISIGVRPAVRPLAPSVLVLAAVYAIWSLLARPDETMSPNRFRAATLLVDATLITLWLVATGGTNSEYWTLYLIALVAVAMRYSLVETFFSALGLAVLYVIVLSINGGASPAALLSRLPVLLIAGFALGVLAQQRR